jgi:hypothetical protein
VTDAMRAAYTADPDRRGLRDHQLGWSPGRPDLS